MRLFSAWFLLSIAIFQWFGSYISFSILHSYVVEYQMDYSETLASKSIKSKTGVELHLKSTTEQYINMMGYSNTFIVSTEINGEKELFKVVENAYEVVEIETEINKDQQDTQEKDVALFKSILSEFVAADDLAAPQVGFIYISKDGGFINDLVTLFDPAIITPPPQFIS